MVTLSIDSSDLMRGMTAAEKRQVPQAAVWALNDTAYEVLDHVRDRMGREFDRPTRFALNAFMVWRAKKSTLLAEVRERPSVSSKHFLKVEEVGGARPKTGLERMIGGQGHGGAAAVPASGAKLNAFGNWSPAERKKAMTALRGEGDSARAGSSGGRRRTRSGYFVAKRGGHLSPGVYRRKGKSDLVKVLHLTTAMPTYRPRLGFQDGAEEVFADRFPANFAEGFRRAMATAR